MADGLSCSMACGIFPDQGLNLHPLHCKAILNLWTTREVQVQSFFVFLWVVLGGAMPGLGCSMQEFCAESLWQHARSLVASHKLLVVACEI